MKKTSTSILKKQLFFTLSILFLSTICFNNSAQGQFFAAGEDPASVKWLQIQTANFQIIFPKGYEEHGKHIADMLEWSYEHLSKSLEHQPRKVSVIVHNQTVVSNGFVSWAPRRIELYTTPPSDNDFHFWMERLVIHEFRHVVQVDKLNQGLTRLMGILFGEMGTGAVVGHIPLWFIEGDAVAVETALTNAGRGRLPRFEQGLRAQVLTRGIHSYQKAYLGSYKEHVPNYYELGYQLVANARAEHGANIWSPMVDNVARRPWGLYPFSAEMKRQLGRGKIKHYQHTMHTLQKAWTKQYEAHTYTDNTLFTQKTRLFSSYNHPKWINDTTLIAIKTGLRDIPHIVTVDQSGKETPVHYPGFVYPNSFDYRRGKLVWSQFSPDPRWAHRNYAEIILYDIRLQMLRQITRKGKYFSPTLSPAINQIAATSISPEGLNSLVILDTLDGREVWTLSYPDNDFIMQPTWSPCGEKITIVALNNTGKRLDEITVSDGTVNTLFRAENADISNPVYWGEDILFNGTFSGIDNIFQYKRTEKKVYQIISSEFGGVNASVHPSEELIAYSDYTSDGYKLKLTKTSNLFNKPLNQVKDHSVAYHKTLAKQEKAVINTDSVPRKDHAIQRFSRFRNLFLLHSWFPAKLDIDNIDINPGGSLFFQNKLSTSFAQLGFQWDTNEETARLLASYTYRGWYPVIDLSAETGERRLYYSINDDLYNFLWQENNLRITLSTPLNFQHNEYFMGVTPLVSAAINQAANSRNTPDSIFAGQNRYLLFQEVTFYTQNYRLLAFRQRRSVARDMYPRFGQVIDLQYRHSPFSTDDMGSLLSARATLFFPGFLRHHGTRFTLFTQEKNLGENDYEDGTFAFTYQFSNAVNYPRGFTGRNDSKLSGLMIDYAFPLFYPDLSVPYFLYIKRIQASLFYDQTYATRFPDPERNMMVVRENLWSYGFTLSSNLHVSGFFAPLTAGVQVAFPLGSNPTFQFIYRFSF